MKFELYRSGVLRREWRWRLRAQNGRIIADSGEGYRNRADAEHGIVLVKRSADAPVVSRERTGGGR